MCSAPKCTADSATMPSYRNMTFRNRFLRPSEKRRRDYPTRSEKEVKKRIDLRGEIIFTIDPEDAKDFDDAVSLVTNKDGTVLLGVHIADVSHFVREASALDTEALARSTSVYLVGEVIPML